jgi:SAM-dependent methyltransferase
VYWKKKAAIFRWLSHLPFGSDVHYQLQRRVTREWPRRREVVVALLDAARRIRARSAVAQSYIEIGAGRDLAVALALRMLGAQTVLCLDVDRLAKLDLIQHTAGELSALVGRPVPDVSTWSRLQAFGIEYAAPSYLEQVVGRQFDCFFSVDTLEHIPPVLLLGLLRHARSLLRPGGTMVHMIDYGDHFARGDELSRFNFLQYDETSWSRYQSRFQYVNRLRHSQLIGLLRAAGLEVVLDEPTRCDPEASIVANLAPEFRVLDTQDVFTLRALVVARPTSVCDP